MCGEATDVLGYGAVESGELWNGRTLAMLVWSRGIGRKISPR